MLDQTNFFIVITSQKFFIVTVKIHENQNFNSTGKIFFTHKLIYYTFYKNKNVFCNVIFISKYIRLTFDVSDLYSVPL